MTDLISFLGENIDKVYVLILSIFVGVEVIGKVPSVLHTPLMSGANAIHGVVIVGSIIVMMNSEPDNMLALSLGFAADVSFEEIIRIHIADQMNGKLNA